LNAEWGSVIELDLVLGLVPKDAELGSVEKYTEAELHVE
jgi:hypothetical protein